MLFYDRFLSDRHSALLIDPRVPVRLSWLDEHYLATEWSVTSGNAELPAEVRLTKFFLMEMPVTTTIGCAIDWQGSRFSVLLNTNHALVQWLGRVECECKGDAKTLRSAQFEMLMSLLDGAFRYAGYGNDLGRFQNYLDAWSSLPDLSPDLCPPELRLSSEMFKLPHW